MSESFIFVIYGLRAIEQDAIRHDMRRNHVGVTPLSMIFCHSYAAIMGSIFVLPSLAALKIGTG